MYMCIYIYIYTYVCVYVECLAIYILEGRPAVTPFRSPLVRDNHLYTTTNKCLQCLLKIKYTVF